MSPLGVVGVDIARQSQETAEASTLRDAVILYERPIQRATESRVASHQHVLSPENQIELNR